MNILHKVTLSSLKKNKRRTLVTVLGTAVAVATVTALAVLLASVILMIRNSSIINDGLWHAAFPMVDNTALPILQQQDNIKHIDTKFYEGFAKLPNREHATLRELAITGVNIESLPRLPIQLTEGRLPQQPGEILLSTKFLQLSGMDWQLDQTVHLDFGYYQDFEEDPNGKLTPVENRSPDTQIKQLDWVSEGNKTYTIVGFANLGSLEREWQDSFTAITIFAPEDTRAGKDYFSANVVYKKINRNIFNETRGLAQQLAQHYTATNPNYPMLYAEALHYYHNSDLLVSYGILYNDDTLRTIVMFFAVLLGIVLIGSISLISNAFSISLNERIRSLGMLAGVGATKKQKRSTMFFEAAVIGILAIPPGILGGMLGIGITLHFLGAAIGSTLNSSAGMQFTFPLWAVAFTLAFSIIILLISAFLPALRAAKISPVAAMRGTGNRDKIRKTRAGQLIGRLLGFEAGLGIRNSKRSRRRYHAIVSSLIVSVVLFISVSSAMQYIKNSFTMTAGRPNEPTENYTIAAQYITYRADAVPQLATILEQVRSLPDAGTIDAYSTFAFSTSVPASLLSEDTKKEIEPNEYPDNNSYTLIYIIYALEQETFNRYVAQAGIDTSALNIQNPCILLSPQNVRTATGGWATIHSTTLATGDTVDLTAPTPDAESPPQAVQKLQVAAISSISPNVVLTEQSYSAPANYVTIVTNMAAVEPYFSSSATDFGERQELRLLANSSNPEGMYTAMDSMPIPKNIQKIVNDLSSRNRRIETMLLILAVFTYGFVILISLVCTANIFNTVSTGILLRARELAMLRSVGLSPKGMNRMFDSETLFYGAKALLWGIPASILCSIFLYQIISDSFDFLFYLPWQPYAIAILGVFSVVGASAFYARSKIKHLNISETLKQENW